MLVAYFAVAGHSAAAYSVIVLISVRKSRPNITGRYVQALSWQWVYC